MSQDVDVATSPGELLAQKKFRCSEIGDAQRFAFLFGKHVRYVEPWGWVCWNERAGRWVKEAPEHFAMKTAMAITAEALVEKDDFRKKEVAVHARAAETSKRVSAMLRFAKTLPELRARPEHFDADPWLLPVSNGVIDLRDGSFGPHRPEALYTMVAPVVYDAEATCPEFDKYLSEALPTANVRDFMLRYMGSCLTGVVEDEKLLVNHGSGRNGKGTLDEVMQNILGEYAWPLTSAAILRRRNEVHSSVILDLRGKRYVSVNEVDDGDRLSVADACRLTGGDRLTASRKHKDAEVFRPTAKLTVWLNPLFEVGSTKDAIWERLLLVEWPVNFSKLGKADGKLKERLRQESSGILNALVRACREWQEVGLLPPKSVLDAVQAYRREDDVERRFIEEHYVLDARSAVRSDVLYDRYKNWCRTVGKMPKKLKGFIIALKDIDGIATGTRDEKNYATVTGIRLTTESPHLQVVQSAPRGLTGESLTRFREISQLLFKPSKGCLAVSSIHKTWSSYVDSYVEEDIPVGTVEDLGATLRALGMNVGLDAKKILAVQGITFVSTEEFRAAYYRKFKTKPWEQWDSDDDNDDESDDGSDDAGLDAEERDMDGGYSEEEASR